MSGSAIFLDSYGTVDASVTNGRIPPISDGCAGLFDFGGSLDQSRVNLVNPGLSGAFVGTPVITADGIIFTGRSAYLDTLIAETAAMTVLVRARAIADLSSSNRVMLAGNYRTRGMSLALEPANTGGATGYQRAGAWYTNPTSGAAEFVGAPGSGTAATITDVKAMNVYALRMGPGIALESHNITAGTKVTTGGSWDRVLGTDSLLIGSCFASNWTGAAEYKRAVVYQRALTPAELATMAAWMTVA